MGLGWGGKGKGQNAPAKRLLEERGDGLADTSGIDDDATAVPYIFQEIDELGIEFGVAAAGPLVVFDDADDRLCFYWIYEEIMRADTGSLSH